MITLLVALVLGSIHGDPPAPTTMAGATVAQPYGTQLNLFLDATTGSDSYNCLSATVDGGGVGPCRTPQVAADKIPTILDGSNDRPSATSGRSGVGSGSTWTVTGAGWTVDQWVGKYLINSTSTAYPIISNTATVLTVTGTPVTGSGTWVISDFTINTNVVVRFAASVTHYPGNLVVKGRRQRSHTTQSSIQFLGPAQALQAGPYLHNTYTTSTTDKDSTLTDGTRTLTITSSPGWTVDQWVGYYVTNGDGTTVLPIISNTADTLEYTSTGSQFFTLGTDDITIISPGATVDGQLFAADNTGSITVADLAFLSNVEPLNNTLGTGSLSLQRSTFTSTSSTAVFIILNSAISTSGVIFSGNSQTTISSSGSPSVTFTNTLFYKMGTVGITGCSSVGLSGSVFRISGLSLVRCGVSSWPRKFINSPSTTFLLQACYGGSTSTAGAMVTITNNTSFNNVFVDFGSNLQFYSLTFISGGSGLQVTDQSTARFTGNLTMGASSNTAAPISVVEGGTLYTEGTVTGTGTSASAQAIVLRSSKWYYITKPTMTTSYAPPLQILVDQFNYYPWANVPFTLDSGSTFQPFQLSQGTSSFRFRSGIGLSMLGSNIESGAGTVVLTDASPMVHLCRPGGAVTSVFQLPVCGPNADAATNPMNGKIYWFLGADATAGNCTVQVTGGSTDTIFTTSAGNTSVTWHPNDASKTKRGYVCWGTGSQWQEIFLY